MVRSTFLKFSACIDDELSITPAARKQSKERDAQYHDDEEFPIQQWWIPRDDPDLVSVVQQIPEDEGIVGTDLRVIEIPDGIEWQIEEWDGSEFIVDKNRIWR